MEEFQTFQGNMELWYAGIKSHVEENMGDGKGKGGGSTDGSTDGKGNGRVDKKEIAVWKLPDDPDKHSFRHWAVAVDQQLEAVHNFKHASFVMNEIRRSDIEIAEKSFEHCIQKANLKIEASLRTMGITGR